MNTLQMYYYVTVAEKRSLSAAGEILMLTPSSLSKTMSRIEQEIGVKLFVRDGKGMELTEDGLTVFRAFRKILSLYGDMQSSFEEQKKQKELHLSIVSTTSSSGTDMVSAFVKRHPEIYVTYKEIPATEFNQDVLLDNYDFLISSTETEVDDEIIRLSLYKHIPFAVISEKSSLAKKTSVTLKELTQEPFINSPPNTNWAKFILKLFKMHGIEIEPILECSYSVRAKAVAAGVGFTIVSETGARMVTPPPGVVILPISDECPPHDMCLFYHSKRPLSLAAKDFIAFAEEYYKNTDGTKRSV